MKFKKNNYYKPKVYKSAKKTVKKATVSVKKIEKIAQRVVSRNVENKQIQAVNTISIRPHATGNDNNIIPLGPFTSFMNLVQGVADSQRIGNKIKVKYASLCFSLFPAPYDGTTNPNPQPSNIEFFIFYDRLNPTSIPTPDVNGDFYQGNSGDAGFSGTLTDLTRWVNTERYRIFYKRTFKLGYQNDGGSGSVIGSQSFANNDYKLNILNFKVNYTKYLVKTLKFDDNETVPTSRNLFAMWICVPASNSSYNNGILPASVSFRTGLTYEDD